LQIDNLEQILVQVVVVVVVVAAARS